MSYLRMVMNVLLTAMATWTETWTEIWTLAVAGLLLKTRSNLDKTESAAKSRKINETLTHIGSVSKESVSKIGANSSDICVWNFAPLFKAVVILFLTKL